MKRKIIKMIDSNGYLFILFVYVWKVLFFSHIHITIHWKYAYEHSAYWVFIYPDILFSIFHEWIN